MAQLVSSSTSSSAAASCGAIQARRRHPAGSRAASAGGAMFGRGVAAPARSAVGSLRCSGLRNVGKGLLLPRDADDVRGSAWRGKRRANVVVRACSTTGRVEEVGTEVEGLYYNVRLSIPVESEVAKWYQTPGQYMDLLPVNSAYSAAATFFIASAPNSQIQGGRLWLDFLIEDVAGTVANELVNSQCGDSVTVSTNSYSSGFDLQSVADAQHVLMFASSYGIGSLRAFIENGFQANQKKTAILYTMYTPGQEPYMDKHATWKQSGVTVEPFQNKVELFDPNKTVVLMNASKTEQARLTTVFSEKGVPDDQILVLWSGIPTKTEASVSKDKATSNFIHMGERHVPFALAI